MNDTELSMRFTALDKAVGVAHMLGAPDAAAIVANAEAFYAFLNKSSEPTDVGDQERVA